MILASALAAPLVGAQSSGGAQRDCDDNAVLRCGGYTSTEINQKYDRQADAKPIFNHFGINSTDVNQLHDNAVSGYVTKGGRVMIGDKTVATGAITVGRQNLSGSTPVTQNGVTFYTRPASASLNQDKLEAYIVMKNSQFQYAIIKSCGNPVKATPTEVVTEKTPPPATVTPTVVPATAECRLINATITPNRQVSVTVNSFSSNAQVTGYALDFGDGTGVTTIGTSNTINTTSAATTASDDTKTSPVATHQYAREGTYIITAFIQVKYPDGQTETKTSTTCRQTITFTAPVVPAGKTETPPPAPAPPPAVLPATGPGEVAGASIAVGLASVLGYGFYGWLARRFGMV